MALTYQTVIELPIAGNQQVCLWCSMLK